MRRYANLLLVGTLVACSHPAVTRRASLVDAPLGTIVTEQDFARLVAGQTLLDALRSVRPSFLHTRGGTPMVSIDGSAASDLSVLALIPVSHVREVRLQRGGRTVLRSNGDVVVGDVLIVTTRTRD